MEKNINEPYAFPFNWPYKNGNGTEYHTGMSLRDYFAAKAIVCMGNKIIFQDASTLATWAYEVADAMLKARELKS